MDRDPVAPSTPARTTQIVTPLPTLGPELMSATASGPRHLWTSVPDRFSKALRGLAWGGPEAIESGRGPTFCRKSTTLAVQRYPSRRVDAVLAGLEWTGRTQVDRDTHRAAVQEHPVATAVPVADRQLVWRPIYRILRTRASTMSASFVDSCHARAIPATRRGTPYSEMRSGRTR